MHADTYIQPKINQYTCTSLNKSRTYLISPTSGSAFMGQKDMGETGPGVGDRCLYRCIGM